jgi:integrase
MTKPLYGGTRSRFQQTQTVPVTLKDLVRVAADTIWKGKSYHSTAISNLCDAVDILGNPVLNEIKTEHIDNYIKVLAHGVKNSTINRKLSNLHTLLKFGYDREWVAKLPKFSWQAEDNERIRWLTKDEETQLLTLMGRIDPSYAAFCELLIHTGMRRDELRTMEREQIDGDYLRLWKTKTKKARSVPLTPRAKELVNQYVPFKIELSPFRTAWLRVKKEMGLENDPNFVLHMLRHTTATRLLDTTGNIAVVQKMLGHKKIATTMRYAHISDDSLLDAIRLTAEKHSTHPVTP